MEEQELELKREQQMELEGLDTGWHGVVGTLWATQVGKQIRRSRDVQDIDTWQARRSHARSRLRSSFSVINSPFSILLLSLFILLFLPDAAFAQRWRQPAGPWSGELNIRSAILLDEEVLYGGGRVAYELMPSLSAGVTLTVLLEHATRRRRESFEAIELFGAIGPTIEYSDQLRGRVNYYVSVSGGIGLARRRVTGEGGEVLESGMLLMAEPEIGLIGVASRRLRLRLGLGGLVGRIAGSDSLIYGGPSANFGVRMTL